MAWSEPLGLDHCGKKINTLAGLAFVNICMNALAQPFVFDISLSRSLLEQKMALVNMATGQFFAIVNFCVAQRGPIAAHAGFQRSTWRCGRFMCRACTSRVRTRPCMKACSRSRSRCRRWRDVQLAVLTVFELCDFRR